MKEVKAYVRITGIDYLIESLENAGAKDITVTRVDALGDLADYEFDRWHIVRRYSETYFKVAKIEIVCTDEQAKIFMNLIKENAHTGERGDGRVFIANIEEEYQNRGDGRKSVIVFNKIFWGQENEIRIIINIDDSYFPELCP